MKKLLFLLTIYVCTAVTGYAQKREIVLVDYFTKEQNIPLIYSERIRAQVMEGFKLRNREDILDAEYIPQMNPQRPGGYQPGVNYEQERNNAIANSGARYILTGHVAAYRFSQAPVAGKVEYTSTFKVLLNGYDLATGNELEPEQYDLIGKGPTLDAADAKAIQLITGRINFYVERRMKFETEVLQICEADQKGRVLELYIGAGSGIGVKAGDQFDVYAEDQVQGRAIRRELGRVTVHQVEGPEAARCSMKKKQAPLIIQAFNSGKRLIAVSAGEALFY